MLAEQLKKEMGISVYDIPNFEKNVINSIKKWGRFSITCDYPMPSMENPDSPSENWAPIRYESVIVEWGKENGFQVVQTKDVLNSRKIIFKL